MKLTKEDLIKIIKEELEAVFESEAEAKKHKGKPGSEFTKYPLEEDNTTLDIGYENFADDIQGEGWDELVSQYKLMTSNPGGTQVDAETTIDPYGNQRERTTTRGRESIDPKMIENDYDRKVVVQKLLDLGLTPNEGGIFVSPNRTIKVQSAGNPTSAPLTYSDPIVEKKKTKVTKKGQERVSKKIGHLIGKEGKPKDQAAAIAYSMEKRGELKKGGKHSV